ncbi:MAG: alpha/beta fold hydrolase [Chloroflexi bacterium]|nr:alpha/beta fold hydrolase [Chloroflexota bacterium]
MKQLFLLVITFLLLSACQNQTEPAPTPTAVLTTCQLSGGVTAQCGSITVPEDRSQTAANGRTLDIHFAVLPATLSNPQPDPIFMLAGGPGQAAITAFPQILPALQKLNQSRDIVLVDQRGTGQSNPLACPNVRDLPLDSTEEMVSEALAACRQELAADNDLTQYHTTIAMTDLDAVRAALGYGQINLIGVSYGSRAALEYMRLFPEQTRSVVLNAVAGPELVLQLQAPRDGQRALDLFFARCAADDACSETFPNLEAEFASLLTRLDEEVAVTLVHPVTGEIVEMTLGREDFMQSIFALLYSADFVSLLPLLIHNAAASGDVAPIVSPVLSISSSTGIYQGMFYAVVCSEDAPLIDPAQTEALQAGALFGLVADDLLTACADWPRADVPEALRQPVTAVIPTLLLSGEADPITPPQYADSVAAALPQSLHLVIPGYGHDVLTMGCIPSVVAAFISSGSVTGLDTTCLAEIQPPPFFVSPAGPRP